MQTEPQPQTLPQPNPAITRQDAIEIQRNGRLFQNNLCYMRTGTVYAPQPTGWRRLTRKRPIKL